MVKVSEFGLLLVAIAGWFGSNFLYSLVWKQLEVRFLLKESDMAGWVLKLLPPLIAPILILAIGGYTFGWWRDIPTMTVGTYNNSLKVLKTERGSYEAGKQSSVNVFTQYDGDSPIRLRDDFYIVVLEDLNDANANPDAMAALEDQAWKQYVDASYLNTQLGTLIAPHTAQWHTIRGPVLSEDQVTKLSTKGGGAALLFMGSLKWTDADGTRFETQYCASTQENSGVYVICRNHNGPANVGSESTFPEILRWLLFGVAAISVVAMLWLAFNRGPWHARGLTEAGDDRFTSMQEAAAMAYGELRAANSSWGKAADTFAKQGIREQIYFAGALAGEIPVYGKHPPSDIRERIDAVELKKGIFKEDGASFYVHGETNPLYVEISVKSDDLSEAIKRMQKSKTNVPW